MAQAFLVQKSGGGINQTLPEQVTAFHAAANSTPAVVLTWTNPTEYFGGVLIVKKIGSAPTEVNDGEKIYSGTAETFTDADVQFDTEYFYRAFAYNSKKQYQTLYAVASAEPRSGLLVSTLPVGALIKVPVLSAYQSRFGENIMWKVADQNHDGYPDNSTTLITEKIIQVMCFDAKEPSNNTNGQNNYGYSRYLYSNILQWLNSDAPAGEWYSAQHSKDAPPIAANISGGYNPYTSWAGFLAMLEPKFVTYLLDTTQIVAKPTPDGGGTETVISKMFLPSTTEVGLENENNIAEGSLLALFSDDTSRIAYPTAECVSNSGLSSSDLAVNKGWCWMLRTPYQETKNAYQIRRTNSSGKLGVNFSNDIYNSPRPFCNISGNALVDFTPNADGSYTLI